MPIAPASSRARALRAGLALACALVAREAPAAVFQAGPDAVPPASIQAAIDAALAAGPGDHELRVQGVPFANVATIEVPSSFTAGTLRIRGGWNASFTAQSGATPTVVDGDGASRVLRLRPGGGTVILEDVEIRGGVSTADSAGVEVTIGGSAAVEIRRCRIEQNQAPAAAGLGAFLSGGASLVVEDCSIVDNLAANASGTAVGAGVYLSAGDSATFALRRNRIAGNTAQPAANQATGAGLYALWCDAASGEITDNVIEGNEIPGAVPQVASGGALWQGSCGEPASGTVEVRRNRWLDGIGEFAEQVSLISSGTGTLLFTDSLVAGGAEVGISLDARDASVMRVTNVTIADQASAALTAFREPGATISIYNSIVFGNATDALPGDLTAGSNLVGVDPLFTGPLYRPGAPAIDVGTASPPGGLGPSDLLGAPRTIGAAPDVGAIEVPAPGAAAATCAALAALALVARRRRD